MLGSNNSSKKVTQNNLLASIAQLEAERDDALKMAEQTVLNAIHVLKSYWSVPCKTNVLITLHEDVFVHPRCTPITSDKTVIRQELARQRWYTQAMGINTTSLSTEMRLAVQTLIDWVKTPGIPVFGSHLNACDLLFWNYI
jgi:hypothetical protein